MSRVRSAEQDATRAPEIVQQIREVITVPPRYSLIGRAVEDGRREIVISHGRNTAVALYRRHEKEDVVLEVRAARETGYSAD